MKSHAFQRKYWSKFMHIWKELWVRNMIGLLWSHSHNELRLIEVEVNLTWICLDSFRGQVDSIHEDFWALLGYFWLLWQLKNVFEVFSLMSTFILYHFLYLAFWFYGILGALFWLLQDQKNMFWGLLIKTDNFHFVSFFCFWFFEFLLLSPFWGAYKSLQTPYG